MNAALRAILNLLIRCRLITIGRLLRHARRGEWETNTSKACKTLAEISNFLRALIADPKSKQRAREIASAHLAAGARLGLW
jgi:hypothetical protein